MSEAVVTGSASRIWNGVQFPSAGTWVLDPTHTSIEFEARHLMVAKVKGRFGEFAGALHIAADPTQSRTDVTIKAASIDTRTQQRDDHLRSGDFFEVETYPELTFVSTGVQHEDGDAWTISGDLTIRGITRPVTLKTEYNGQMVDPWGKQRAFFSAQTKIDREDWGLTWNAALETGGLMVGKELKLSLEIESVLQDD